MIDSVGGPVRVNNLLSTQLHLIYQQLEIKTLKKMERRVGNIIEKVASMSTESAAKDQGNGVRHIYIFTMIFSKKHVTELEEFQKLFCNYMSMQLIMV
jgi:hypothetical protein